MRECASNQKKHIERLHDKRGDCHDELNDVRAHADEWMKCALQEAKKADKAALKLQRVEKLVP